MIANEAAIALSEVSGNSKTRILTVDQIQAALDAHVAAVAAAGSGRGVWTRVRHVVARSYRNAAADVVIFETTPGRLLRVWAGRGYASQAPYGRGSMIKVSRIPQSPTAGMREVRHVDA